MSSPDYI
ncbi:uncharacterized protein FFNC_11690 [Fusarium fujikuroi]|nr:uncharacterized protein FFNC_11690 [Fusarium fujikuroi]